MKLRRHRRPAAGEEVAAWLATSGWPAAERDRLAEPAALEALLSSPPPATMAAFLEAHRRPAAGAGPVVARRAG